MEVEIVKELGGSGAAKQVLLKTRENPPRYFVASTVVAFDTGKMETLVFASDEDGEIESFTALAGGILMKRSDAIKDLEKRLDSDELGGNANIEGWLEEVGGPIGASLSMIDSIANQRESSEPDEDDLE